jgi:hypothetical protein
MAQPGPKSDTRPARNASVTQRAGTKARGSARGRASESLDHGTQRVSTLPAPAGRRTRRVGRESRVRPIRATSQEVTREAGPRLSAKGKIKSHRSSSARSARVTERCRSQRPQRHLSLRESRCPREYRRIPGVHLAAEIYQLYHILLRDAALDRLAAYHAYVRYGALRRGGWSG